MVSILTSKEPYSEIHELPTLRKDLIDILTNMYDVKSEPIIKMINNTIEYIENEVKMQELIQNSVSHILTLVKVLLVHQKDLMN